MKEDFGRVMSEVIVIKIKKRTLWILLVIFLAIIGYALVWYFRRRGRLDEDYANRKIEAKKLYDEAKNYAMREHIKHVDRGERYCKNCNMCNGDWEK